MGYRGTVSCSAFRTISRLCARFTRQRFSFGDQCSRPAQPAAALSSGSQLHFIEPLGPDEEGPYPFRVCGQSCDQTVVFMMPGRSLPGVRVGDIGSDDLHKAGRGQPRQVSLSSRAAEQQSSRGCLAARTAPASLEAPRDFIAARGRKRARPTFPLRTMSMSPCFIRNVQSPGVPTADQSIARRSHCGPCPAASRRCHAAAAAASDDCVSGMSPYGVMCPSGSLPFCGRRRRARRGGEALNARGGAVLCLAAAGGRAEPRPETGVVTPERASGYREAPGSRLRACLGRDFRSSRGTCPTCRSRLRGGRLGPTQSLLLCVRCC